MMMLVIGTGDMTGFEREALLKMGGPLISHAKDEEQSASLFKQANSASSVNPLFCKLPRPFS